MNYEKSRFTVDLPIEYAGRDLTAIHHTLTEAFLVAPRADWVALLQGGWREADPATVRSLCEHGILVKGGTDEVAVYENWKQQHVYDSSVIKSKIIVTRRCNCACVYCIIDKEARDMTSETARAMDKFYLGIVCERKPSRVIDEAGGAETLLNPKVLVESATRRYHFCQGLGIPYALSMVTNGTLIDRSIIETLVDVGLNTIRVSLAGPAKIHNRLRPFMGGGATYEVILRNLSAISGLVKIVVECQYDGGSSEYEAIPQLMEDLERYGIGVAEIRFCPILPTRNGSPFRAGIGDPAVYLYLTREARKKGYPRLDAAPSNRCAADFRYHFVFDADGSIIPCPALQCGEPAYGDVFKGVDFIAESQLLKRNLPDRCLNRCELLPLCMGGCRHQALVEQGDFQGIDCRYDMLRVFLEDFIRERAEGVPAADGVGALISR